MANNNSSGPNVDKWSSEQNLALIDIQRDIKQLQEGVKEIRQIMEDIRHQLRIIGLQADITQAKVQASLNTKPRLSWLTDIIENGILIATVFFAFIVIRENLVAI